MLVPSLISNQKVFTSPVEQHVLLYSKTHTCMVATNHGPHDIFPNRARLIANGSRPVARVHTGATGMLVPVSRDHLATWNEHDRSRPLEFVIWTLEWALGSTRQITRCYHTPN